MNETLPQYDIVLLGAGHTNAHIIRMWRMDPLPGARLTCVSDHLKATYSGMLAGVLAGEYDAERMEIDLVRLCASCGVRLIHGRGIGIDRERQLLLVEGRPPVAYDSLSIGTGSQPLIPPGGEQGLSIKPMQNFLMHLRERFNRALVEGRERPLQVIIVGGGAAGVELACCLDEFLEQNYGTRPPRQLILLDGARQVLREKPERARRLAIEELRRRGIVLKLERRVERVEEIRVLICDSGEQIATDLVIWATTARPSPLLAELGLPVDKLGFLLTRSTLQSTDDERVFAVGDAGTVEGDDYAKAGVFAVRQGPVLWENLQRQFRGQPLSKWRRQKEFLSLIYTGEQRAILTYRGWSFHGGWCWRWKDRIDSRFMDVYQDYAPPMMLEEPPTEEFDLAQQCGGCGCKASANVLAQSLPSLEQAEDPRVLLGLDEPDDVAVLKNAAGGATAVSTDFFSAFVDDPYLLGRIAAINAMSDLFAKGITPTAAVSMVVLPPGQEKQQARLLGELLAGAAAEFQTVGVTIVGGHSVVGPKLVFGFTVLGDADEDVVMRKATPAVGDSLLLTKPLGVGVLLAAHMRARCRAEWWSLLLKSMLLSNRKAAYTAQELEISASTDVTGFGLAGHLLEMLSSGGVAAEISLSKVPVLPGVFELLTEGLESSLAPANRASCGLVDVDSRLEQNPHVGIVFDPQTSGGLLLSVPAAQLDTLRNSIPTPTTVIGQVVSRGKSRPRLRLVP